jgi:ribulose-phosphate 3-epimerase
MYPVILRKPQLMVSNPDRLLEEYVSAGSDYVTVHFETSPHLHRTVQMIRQFGSKAGVANNPATPGRVLEEILIYVDLVFVMTVNPGFCGQRLIDSCLAKVRLLRETILHRRLGVLISVDGGIKVENSADVIGFGADINSGR